MNKFIFTLFFAVGLGTAFADAIVRDKSIKEETPKYDMTDIMDFGKKTVLLLGTIHRILGRNHRLENKAIENHPRICADNSPLGFFR